MELNTEDCPYLNGKCPFFGIWVKKNESLANSIRRLYSNNLFKRCRRYQLYEAGKQVPDDLWPSGPQVE